MTRHITFFSLSLTALLLAGCKSTPVTEPTEATTPTVQSVKLTPEQMKTAQIQTGELSQRDMSVLLQLNGMVEVPPQNLVSVSFPLGGYLKESHLLPGMHVRKGEAIAEMEDPKFLELQQEYLMTKSQLETYRLEYERQQSLNASKASSDKLLEQARSAFESSKVSLAALRGKLSFLNIDPDKLNEQTLTKAVKLYSPIEGYVTQVHVNVGKYVDPTQVLFDLVNPSDLHLALTVFERDLATIALGQKVTAWQPNHPEKKYTAEVILSGRLLDENRSTPVHCHFDEVYPELLPGMYLTAEVQTQVHSVPCLPEAAVVRSGSRELVYVEKGAGIFEPIEIKTGTTEAGFVQIMEGADALKGKMIVTQNAYAVLMTQENVAEEE